MRTMRRVLAAAGTMMMLGVSTVALAGDAQAASTCNARVLRSGLLTRDGTYGHAGVPTVGNDPSCLLRRGAVTGVDPARSPVWWLQLTLRECYGRALVLDGNYGRRTASAVRVAQSRAGGLAVDGVYGPRTRSAMVWYTRRSAAHGQVLMECLPYRDLH